MAESDLGRKVNVGGMSGMVSDSVAVESLAWLREVGEGPGMSATERGEETHGVLPRPKMGLQARLGLRPGERKRGRGERLGRHQKERKGKRELGRKQ